MAKNISTRNKRRFPVRLGIIADGDPKDVRTWSGVPHFMTKAISKRVTELVYLPANTPSRFVELSNKAIRQTSKFSGRRSLPQLSHKQLKHRSDGIAAALRS